MSKNEDDSKDKVILSIIHPTYRDNLRHHRLLNMMNDDLDNGLIDGTIGCLDDDDPEVRSDAADLLSRVGCYIRGEFVGGNIVGEAIPDSDIPDFERDVNTCLEVLVKKVSDGDDGVRYSVFTTITSLCYSLHNNNLAVPRWAVDVLVTHGLQEDNSFTREGITDELRYIGNRDDIKVLRKLLETETEDSVREPAMIAIEMIEAREDGTARADHSRG